MQVIQLMSIHKECRLWIYISVFVISPSAIWVQTRHTMIFLGDNGKGASFGTWISNADPIHPEFS